MQEEEYQISEKDIEGAIRWLKVNDPANANRDKAIALLKDMKTGFHQMSHNNPARLLELQQEVNQPKPKKS